MEPRIIFEDDDIVVIDKPSGLIVHAAREGGQEPSVASWLIQKFPQADGIGEEGRRGIVHRLDRETSGVMVAAKTLQAYARLKKEFARREVRKTYRAFVYGNIKEERGIIEKSIGRSATGNRSARLPSQASDAAREAHTTFKTLQRASEASYLELYPMTGRTHQLRVHLSALQHPIICDARYAPRRAAILGFMRLALHAYKLSFIHPLTGEETTFEAPLPADFLRAERQLAAFQK